MKRRIAAGLLAGALALSLSACSADASTDASDSATASESASAAAEQTPPEVVVSSEGMPTVEDGDVPKIVFPDSQAPKTLQVSVIEEGDGAEISRTDWISAQYVGAVWGSEEPFDNSYERGSALTVPLGQLVTGWAWGLEGRHVGDKLLLSIPPEYGYGADGQPSAGIGGEDTIVFYIEIEDAWDFNMSGDPEAAVEADADALPITYDGALGEPVTKVTVKDGQEEPTEQKAQVIARGSGPELKSGDRFFYQVAQAYWDNSAAVTTWAGGEEQGTGIQQGQIGGGSPLDSLEGIPVGSRVLIVIPGTDDSEASPVPPVAAVVDVVAALPAA